MRQPRGGLTRVCRLTRTRHSCWVASAYAAPASSGKLQAEAGAAVLHAEAVARALAAETHFRWAAIGRPMLMEPEQHQQAAVS